MSLDTRYLLHEPADSGIGEVVQAVKDALEPFKSQTITFELEDSRFFVDSHVILIIRASLMPDIHWRFALDREEIIKAADREVIGQELADVVKREIRKRIKLPEANIILGEQ